MVSYVQAKSGLPHPTKSHMGGGDASRRAMEVCASTRHAVVIVHYVCPLLLHTLVYTSSFALLSPGAYTVH